MSSLKVVLFIVLMSIAASFTNAQPKGPGKEAHHLKFLITKLHLTDQQADRIKSLQSVQMKQMIDHQADLKKAMVDLKAIKDKDNFTRKDVLDQVEKLNRIKNEMALAKANHLMDIWEILTPEQQKIAKANPEWFMPKHKGMMREGMKHPRPVK
jgi:Spy/CpxP family protein refolding chaperone